MQISIKPSATMASKRIFVVETDEVIRSALKFMLRAEHEIHALADLEQAYARGRAWKPDLVLLGFAIVKDQGLRVLGDIATRLPGAGILLVADFADNPLAQACCAWGAHDVLGKPISIDSVRYKVDNLLVQQEQPTTAAEALTPVFR